MVGVELAPDETLTRPYMRYIRTGLLNAIIIQYSIYVYPILADGNGGRVNG